MGGIRERGNMVRKILILLFILLALVLLAGIYRFNFTNGDIYLIKEHGHVIPLEEDVE